MRTNLDKAPLPDAGMDVPSAEELLADFILEHDLGVVLVDRDDVSFQMAPLMDVTTLFPGSSVDEFGVMTGGWPTDSELAFHRSQAPSAPRKRRWFRR